MRAKDYHAILQTASDLLDGAMHVVDADGITILYNEAMAKLEKIDVSDVLGKRFREVFSNLPEEDSTLFRALTYQRPTINKQQTYLNIYGKEITTINSTVPIIVDNKVIAAIEVARDITDIKNMSDTILDLRNLGPVEDIKEPTKGKSAHVRNREKKIRQYGFSDLIGNNPSFLTTINIAKKAALNDAPVFIYGETGTGKELFTQSIHYEGTRRNGPFLAQNCAAIPESLLEGILFGTAKGGFTGAVDRAGLFEQASGGTLLLDEISAMPYDLQSKLLRVLQEDYIRRVGGTKDIPVDVRIIATVNEPSEELIKNGTLRKDLFYRLNLMSIKIPPLRERKDDIPLLAEYFLEKHNKKYNKEIWMISDSAIEKLLKNDYAGNVRQLENIIASAVLSADKEHVLTEKDIIIENGYSEKHTAISGFNHNASTMNEYVDDIEKAIIQQYLIENERNISKTARELGITRQNLQYMIKKFNLTK